MFPIRNSKRFCFEHLRIRICDLFRLPARSRFGEGRDFDIRISNLLNHQDLFGSG